MSAVDAFICTGTFDYNDIQWYDVWYPLITIFKLMVKSKKENEVVGESKIAQMFMFWKVCKEFTRLCHWGRRQRHEPLMVSLIHIKFFTYNSFPASSQRYPSAPLRERKGERGEGGRERRGRGRVGRWEGRAGFVSNISPYTFMYLHIPLYTFIYIHIPPNAPIYPHIPHILQNFQY